MNPYGKVVEDGIETLKLAIVIAVLCMLAGAFAAAGINMDLFYAVVVIILAVAGIIGTVSLGMFIYDLFENTSGFGGI
jgi:hypothetical protein